MQDDEIDLREVADPNLLNRNHFSSLGRLTAYKGALKKR